jgi:hypothetical protein
MNPKHIEALAKLNPCDAGAAWFAAQKTPQKAWDACVNPGWMFWLLKHTPRDEGDHQKIVLVACGIARTVLYLVPQGEDRPRLAIEAAEAWAANPTAKMAKMAEVAAQATARAAWGVQTGQTAHAAWAAAGAAWAASRTATWMAWAMEAEARAAEAAWRAARKEHCDIIRRHFPKWPLGK